LPTLEQAHFRPIVDTVRALLSAAPQWQEAALVAAFRGEAPAEIKRRKPGRELKEMLTRLPVMLTPLLNSNLRAKSVELPAGTPRVNTPQREKELRERLEMALWERAFDFVRECAVGCDGMGAIEARECVLARQRDFNAAQETYWKKVSAIVEKQIGDWLLTASFMLTVARGAQEKQADIDRTLTELASGWTLERQAVVDRNILRLAGYEMLFLPNIPAPASINEAVELAKKYSTAESGRFVNGVLGALALRTGSKNMPDAVDEMAEQAVIEELETEDIELGGETKPDE
jgi:transcription antitermination protein NusB